MERVAVINESDILIGARQGFTNAIGLAKSRQEFRKEVAGKLLSINLKLIRLEGSEPLKDRLNTFSVSNEFLKCSKTLMQNKNTVAFTTFHTWD